MNGKGPEVVILPTVSYLVIRERGGMKFARVMDASEEMTRGANNPEYRVRVGAAVVPVSSCREVCPCEEFADFLKNGRAVDEREHRLSGRLGSIYE